MFTMTTRTPLAMITDPTSGSGFGPCFRQTSESRLKVDLRDP
jgi:hypothetical protein